MRESTSQLERLTAPVFACALLLAACRAPLPEELLTGSFTPTLVVDLVATVTPHPTHVAGLANTAIPVAGGGPSDQSLAGTIIPSSQGPADDPESELARVLATESPERDSARLASEFGRLVQIPSMDTFAIVRPFWVNDPSGRAFYSIDAHLVRRADRVDAWSQDGIAVDLEGLDRSLARFTSQTRAAVARRLFPSFPRAETEPISIVNARINGVIGYFSSMNEYPRGVVRRGNSLPMILMSVQNARPGSVTYDAGLAHEFTHLLQWRADRAEDTWVSEGTAEYAIGVAGLAGGSSRSAFLRSPRTQLNHWSERLEGSPAHYGAADLFFRFAADQLGGDAFVADVLRHPGRGLAAIDEVVRRGGRYGSVDELVVDWMGSNVGDQSGRLRYIAGGVPAITADPMLGPLSVKIPQYSAHYIALTPDHGGATIDIRYAPTIRLVGSPTRSEPFWWSRRGDGTENRLTRTVDLRRVTSASLHFSIWHDLEEDFDYGFVSGSVDGGRSWRTLPAGSSRTSDPNDANLGYGFTGATSGWLSERVDLAPFVGEVAQLRFHVVTDDSYSGAGMSVADIEVPEIGWRDRADDAGWVSEGFARVVNRVPQRAWAAVVVPGDSASVVLPLALAEPGRLVGRVPPLAAGQRAAIVVAPLTPVTLEQGTFEISLVAASP